MGYQSINPQYGFSLFSNLFVYDNVSPVLLSLDRDWTQVWDIMNKLNGGKSIGFNDPFGKFNRPFQPRQSVMATIATATQSGANLLLTFTDPNYSGFRKKDYVKDDNMFEGRVISNDPNIGGVLIEPFNNPVTTLTAGTHFAANGIIRSYGDTSGNLNSTGKIPLYNTIENQVDYSTVYRDTCQRARREKFKTHMGLDGIAYFYTMDEREMVKRALKYYGKIIMFGTGGTKQSVVEGAINQTRGVRQSIIEDGIYDALTAPISQAQFEAGFFAVANTSGNTEQSLEVWAGRRAIAQIQSFYTNLLQYTGTLNTLGGASVRGTDFHSYASAGVNVTFRILGCLNDGIEVPDWMQDSVYIIDTTPMQAQTESGQITMVSPLQKIHWSANTNTTDEIIYKVVPGMTRPGESNDTAEVYANYQIAANSNDGYACEYLHDFGLSFVADRAYLAEWKH